MAYSIGEGYRGFITVARLMRGDFNLSSLFTFLYEDDCFFFLSDSYDVVCIGEVFGLFGPNIVFCKSQKLDRKIKFVQNCFCADKTLVPITTTITIGAITYNDTSQFFRSWNFILL